MANTDTQIYLHVVFAVEGSQPGLGFLLGLVFYKDVAPLALGFSSGKFLHDDRKGKLSGSPHQEPGDLSGISWPAWMFRPLPVCHPSGNNKGRHEPAL